jgi:hypothetical protein
MKSSNNISSNNNDDNGDDNNSIYFLDWATLPLEVIRLIYDADVDSDSSILRSKHYPNINDGRLVCQRFNQALIRRHAKFSSLNRSTLLELLDSKSMSFLKTVRLTVCDIVGDKKPATKRKSNKNQYQSPIEINFLAFIKVWKFCVYIY